ncbi:hypothetical protein AB6E77_17115 [Vibrio sp. 10N.247.311.18]|uniref:hypothetical protein n=1 Tax=unclassified Vibrio TaxID=2614977 RepID=UPI00336E2786|nr:tRNA-splicing 2'-phosphotransferase [Vibrio chagasii]
MKKLSLDKVEKVVGGTGPRRAVPRGCGCGGGGGGGYRGDKGQRRRDGNEAAAGGHDSRGTGDRSRRGQGGRETER